MRTMAITLMLLLVATVSGSANDDVQDVHLRVQNLGRPDGKQSATLTGRTLPAGTSRLVTVTLRIGDATATLTGKIARHGRVRALGRRLALTTALASFVRIDAEVSGGLTSTLAIDAGDCVRSIRGRRLDCSEASPPASALVDGVYDLVIPHNTAVGTTEAALLRTLPDGTRSLSFHDDALNAASLTMAPDLTLSGYYFLGGDAGVSVSGSAVDLSTPSAARLRGSVASPSGFIPELAFTMQRDAAGTPSTLGGTWNLTLHGGGFQSLDGTMALTFAVAPDGSGPTAPTTIDATGGGTLYTLGTGTCSVAPLGGTDCGISITPPPSVYFIRLVGFLDAGAGSGQGTFAIGLAPQISSQGTWTATR